MCAQEAITSEKDVQKKKKNAIQLLKVDGEGGNDDDDEMNERNIVISNNTSNQQQH